MDARRIWLLAGSVAVGAGGALIVVGWTGGPELEALIALGFSVVAIGGAVVVAAKVE
jgi:hypothetical protein